MAGRWEEERGSGAQRLLSGGRGATSTHTHTQPGHGGWPSHKPSDRIRVNGATRGAAQDVRAGMSAQRLTAFPFWRRATSSDLCRTCQRLGELLVVDRAIGTVRTVVPGLLEMPGFQPEMRETAAQLALCRPFYNHRLGRILVIHLRDQVYRTHESKRHARRQGRQRTVRRRAKLPHE